MARPQLSLRHGLAEPDAVQPVAHQIAGSRRAVGRLGAGLLVAIAAALTVTLSAGTALADPEALAAKASSPEQATQLAADADRQLEQISEQVNDLQAKLVARQTAVVAAGKAVDAARAQVATLDGQMRQVARSAFTGENMSRFNAMMTSSSAEDFLDQVSTLNALAGHTNDVLAQVTAAAHAAEKAKADAESAAAAAKQAVDAVTTKQVGLKKQITDYRAQFAALTTAQQQVVVAQTAGVELTPPAKVSAPTAAAQKAVDVALAQRGDPYVWGAAGPNAFDCSGLTQYAYAAAGVTLPHSSLAQSRMGTPVARADLQPGDLVFFYKPVSHVGMYIGNGEMVNAATTGKPVLVSTVDRPGYVGARRLVG